MSDENDNDEIPFSFDDESDTTDDPFESADEDHGRMTAVDPRFFELLVAQLIRIRGREPAIPMDSEQVRDVLRSQWMRQETLFERREDVHRWKSNLNVEVLQRGTHRGVLQQRWFYYLDEDALKALARFAEWAYFGGAWRHHLTSFFDNHISHLSPHK